MAQTIRTPQQIPLPYRCGGGLRRYAPIIEIPRSKSAIAQSVPSREDSSLFLNFLQIELLTIVGILEQGGIGKVRNFSEDVSHMPEIKDSDVLNAFKGLMAADWAALPSAVVNDAKKAVLKNTADKAGLNECVQRS
ncbi:hypothetical protein Rs2_38791 [Raphanus sativus]|nr:hypothetical protein Rs2_38791 [Raphanus sativus]